MLQDIQQNVTVVLWAVVAIEVLCTFFICGLIVLVVAAELSATNITRDHARKLEQGLLERAITQGKCEEEDADDVNTLPDKGSECLATETKLRPVDTI